MAPTNDAPENVSAIGLMVADRRIAKKNKV